MIESPGCDRPAAVRGVGGGGESDAVVLRFWRFSLVGAIGFLVDVGTLYLAMEVMGVGPIVARAPAFLVAVTFTWIANRAFTFGPSNRHPAVEWLRFLLANSLGSAANMLAYVIALSLMPPGYGAPAIAVACGSIAGLVFNFAMSHLYVFSQRR